jgi:hypothetical protein
MLSQLTYKQAFILALSCPNNQSLEEWAMHEYPSHFQLIDKLAASRIRLPDVDVQDIKHARLKRLYEYTFAKAVKCFPGISLGEDYKPGLNSKSHFRSWFLTTRQPLNLSNEFMHKHGILYYGEIIAYGLNVHYHTVLEFVFSRPQTFLGQILGLEFSQNDKALACPVYSSFDSVYRYMLQQKLDVVNEIGVFPTHTIWVSDRVVKPYNRKRAEVEGEDPLHTQIYSEDYKAYVFSHLRDFEREIIRLDLKPKTRVKLNSLLNTSDYNKALAIAKQNFYFHAINQVEARAREFNSVYFELDYAQTLAPFNSSREPSEYAGEHVVYIKNVPREFEGSIVDSGESIFNFLRMVPVVFYSLQIN